jgi:hypothetical protein
LQRAGTALTQGHVVVRFYGHVLLDLHLVDGLEDGEAMSDAVDTHLLQLGMLEGCEHIARNDLLCGHVSTIDDTAEP